MNWKTLLVFLLIKISAYGQFDNNQVYDRVEDFILVGNVDSAKVNLKRSNFKDTPYSKVLYKLANNSKLSSKEYLTFIKRTTARLDVDYLMLARYFEKQIPVPKKSRIDYDYVEANWHLISRLRNEAEIDRSNKFQIKLEAYINRFDQNLRNVRRAKVLANTHKILMKIIERDTSGILLNEESEREALALNDTNLIILTKYNRCDFLVDMNKLDEYVQVSKYCYQLDSMRPNKSPLYYGNLTHLIDALIYRGGEDEFVIKLLKEFYNSKQRKLSYSLFLKYLRYQKPYSDQTQIVFDLFGIDDVVALCDTLDVQCQSTLNPVEYYYLLNEARHMLYNYKEYEQAMLYMDKIVDANRETYSKNLSHSMANYQSSLVRMEEKAKLMVEKRQKKLYSIIAILSGALFLLVLMAFIRMRYKRKSLLLKNEKIEKQRIALERGAEEKVLLIKEIHHRVKNNFQIVSSLIDLQIKGKSESEIEILKEIQGRINSMAGVHKKLYEDEKFMISLNDYIEDLIKEIRVVLNQKAVTIITDIPDTIKLNIDTAIPLGLIINELVTNAFKYGINADIPTNEIRIQVVNYEGGYELTISDSGNGIPESIDVNSTKTLGLRLVRRLTEQLTGSLHYFNDHGAKFVIKFNSKEPN